MESAARHLDKVTLTLGDNRKVDFSRTMIFMTSNLGAGEMSSLMSPKLGFSTGEARDRATTGVFDEKMTGKMPSLVIRNWGRLSPESRRFGRNPRQLPTSVDGCEA